MNNSSSDGNLGASKYLYSVLNNPIPSAPFLSANSTSISLLILANNSTLNPSRVSVFLFRYLFSNPNSFFNLFCLFIYSYISSLVGDETIIPDSPSIITKSPFCSESKFSLTPIINGIPKFLIINELCEVLPPSFNIIPLTNFLLIDNTIDGVI